MQFLSIPDCLGFRDFSWSPTDNKMACWVPGRDSIPAKITIIEIPSRKEESPQCFRGGCVSYGTDCAPFFGIEGKRVVGCGWSDWRKCGGWLRRGEGVGELLLKTQKIKADEWLHFREEYHAAPLICKSHAFLAYKYRHPPSFLKLDNALPVLGETF